LYNLGIDLGGTNIKAAVVDEEGRIVVKGWVRTPRQGGEAIVSRIAQLCFDVLGSAELSMEDIEAVGVGVPGSVSPETGVINYCSNLNFFDLPFSEMLEKLLGKKVCLENDANLAALAEYKLGSGRGAQSLVAVTLGTGIGGGIIINDRIYSGCNHAGGEIGHFVMLYGGEPCSCGREGCFEAYASAAALIRQTKEKMLQNTDSLMWKLIKAIDEADGETAFNAASQNDAAAIEVVGQYTSYLASGITSIVNIFQPEVLCIGGGLSNQGETLLEPVLAILDKEDYARKSAKRTKVVLAALGNDAGIIGAALLPKYY
jgi:glucokinase